MELLNELNSAADWSDFLKHVDNVTVIHGEAEDDQLRVYGTWETDIDGFYTSIWLILINFTLVILFLIQNLCTARSNLGQERGNVWNQWTRLLYALVNQFKLKSRWSHSCQSGPLYTRTANRSADSQHGSDGSFLSGVHPNRTMRRLLQLGFVGLRTYQNWNRPLSGF